ncbi:MAG: hypothetical protein IMZ57_10990 [Acidobacteria bacterium]|nr:hypothetical protein [Acidobacteriota bacterium]
MFYKGDAIAEIKKIKTKPNGHLDMDSMPPFAVTPSGDRNLGAMVSMLTVAVQQLLNRLEKLEKKQ